MSANIGRLLYRLSGSLSITHRPIVQLTSALLWSPTPVLVQGAIRNYAARKGTRERKAKQSKANKAAKKGKEQEMSTHLKKKMMAKMKQAQLKPLFPDESDKPIAQDNVYISGHYKWPVYDVIEAVNNFKETHHPTMFDNPRALIKAYFELDLSTKKKTQFLENISGVIELPHNFFTGKPTKTICLFCKEKNLNELALKAGAEVAVGLEGLKMFQEGELDSEDYDIFLSHPDVLPDLAPIRGLISKKFPNMKKGTVGFDVVSLVKKYKSGVDYNMTPSVHDPKLGLVQVPIGNVDMPSEEMASNFVAVLKAVLSHKVPGVSNSFVNVGGITSEFSNERFKVSLDKYRDDEEEKEEEVVKKTQKEAAVV